MSCGVGHRQGLNPALLWLWCRLAATALIGPLAWEPPYALSVALKRQKDQKKKKKNPQKINYSCFYAILNAKGAHFSPQPVK